MEKQLGFIYSGPLSEGPVHGPLCVKYSFLHTAVCKISSAVYRTMPGSSVIKNTPLGLTSEIPLLYQYSTSKYDILSG